MYINDPVAVFNASVTPKLHASSIADFQKNLDRLTESAKAWQLSISVKKCCITQVGSIQRTRDRSSHQFVVCNSVLQYVDVVNDLGVVVDQHLTFSEHTDQIDQKAASRCYVVFRCFQSRNTELLVRAFTTYV